LRNPNEVADTLQAGFDFLAERFPAGAGINYREYFSGNRRLAIGYRRGSLDAADGHPIDEDSHVLPGYTGWEHRINIPWGYIGKGENSHGFEVHSDCQPEYCCAHELVHPFEGIRLHGNRNRDEWGDGICDFVRLLVLDQWSRRHERFGPVRDKYQQYIATVDPTGKTNDSNERRYHFAARRILEWFDRNGYDRSPSRLARLFNGDMNGMLGTWRA
jgi:hypothetical protein